VIRGRGMRLYRGGKECVGGRMGEDGVVARIVGWCVDVGCDGTKGEMDRNEARASEKGEGGGGGGGGGGRVSLFRVIR
jgi:hypothetical protein